MESKKLQTQTSAVPPRVPKLSGTYYESTAYMTIIYCITQLQRVTVWQPLSAITLLQGTTRTTASAQLQATTQTPVVPQTRTTTHRMKMMMNSLTSHRMTGEWEMGKRIKSSTHCYVSNIVSNVFFPESYHIVC